jgi:hypothetical protein
MAWLESLAANEGVEEELPTKPENRLEEMPDWLRPTNEQPASPATPEPSPAPGETLPLEPLPPLAGELASQEPAPYQELPPKPENRLEEMPDWLRPVGEQPASPATPEPSPTPRETLPLEPLSPFAGELAAQELAPSEEPAIIAPPAEGTTQPLKIEDDTMAWLESLAAKEGAKEEELPTKPENRLEEMPDWLRPTNEQPVSPVTAEPSPAPGETIPLEAPASRTGEIAALEPASAEELPPLTAPAEGTAQLPRIKDDTMAWLEELAAKEGTKPEGSLTIPPVRAESPPEWIQESKRVPAGSEEASDLKTPQKDITTTSWLRKQDVEEALGKSQPAPDVSQPSAAPSPELPDWLKELERPAAPEEAPKSAEDLPDWLRQPAQTADQGTAAIPTTEPAPEPEMPAWVDEEIPVSEQPAPTTPGEWVPVDEKPTPKSEPEQIAKPVTMTSEIPIQRRVLGGTGMLARIPTQDKDAGFLAAAQAALDANKLNEAMQVYVTLIKKNRLLDEVIHDLREAIYRFPVDIIVWQTLGDASMRANHLQDALDAYTKAEELLR